MPRIMTSNRDAGRPGFRPRVPGVARGKKAVTRLIKRDPSKGITQPFFDTIALPSQGAQLITAMAGANNDLWFRSKLKGELGNNIRVRIVVAGVSTALSVSVSGNDITINSATDAGSLATTTATAAAAAVNANGPASALVQADVAPGDTGAGVVAALAFTNLAGGITSDKWTGAGLDGAASGARPIEKGGKTAGFPGSTRIKIRDRGTNKSLKRR